MRRRIRLTESDLHRIVKESVARILSEDVEEAYNNAQYANLAGQANGARTSLGGRIKGFFNPKWAARKKRQEQLFGSTAAGDNFSYQNSLVQNGGTGDVDTNLDLPGHNATYSNGGQYDYMTNRFNPQNGGEAPFQMRRNQFTSTGGYNGTRIPGRNDKQIYSPGEFKEDFIDNTENDINARANAIDFKAGNSRLNRAYAQGRNAARGKKMVNSKGVNFGGTGTRNGAFRQYGRPYGQ